jgi:flagellar transcriptional activator FlhD
VNKLNNVDASKGSSKDIADLNLRYLILAQQMLRDDRAGGRLQLGLSDEAADLIGSLSVSELVQLANTHFVLCAFRLDELPITQMLQNGKTPQTPLRQAHISIVLASKPPPMALAA